MFDVERTVEPRLGPNSAKASKPPAAPAPKKYEVTAVLGPDYVTMISPDLEMYVDFKAARIVRIFRQNKTYTDVSLYSEAAFRANQLRNRPAFLKAPELGKRDLSPLEVVWLEHQFSMRMPQSKPLAVTDSARMDFSYEGKSLFSASPDGHPLHDDEVTWFVRFLRYSRPQHPDIIKALLARKEVPREFHTYLYNEHLHYSLKTSDSVQRAFDLNAAEAGLTKVTYDASEAMDRADALTPESFTAKCEALLGASRARLKADKPFEAVLLEIDYSLCTGASRTEERSALLASLRREQDVQRFLGAINAETKAAASKAADTMHSLRNQAKSGLEVLKFYEARHLFAAGQDSQAKKLLIDTLRETPFLIGGWADLGDIYYELQDLPTAWRCWDAGRRLAKDHPSFAPVAELEKKLRADHPEFF